MNSNRWIDSSRRAYARLLRLYPREHRQEYGPAMLQLFGDQCRAAQSAHGGWGLLGIWLRTMADLTVSVVREHVSAPRAAEGLLEAAPGAPLPWKGVVLVLLPGLVFLVGQIAQLLGQDWFFLFSRRASYFLILPVLLIWIWKRRFPVWGLIPLGMLIKNAADLLNRFQTGVMPESLPFRFDIDSILQSHHTQIQIGINLTGVVLLASLSIYLLRRQGSRRAFVWMAGFLALAFTQIAFTMIGILISIHWNWSLMVVKFGPIWPLNWLNEQLTWNSHFPAEYLLVILVAALLSRRYGSLALLLPLGYLIPAVLFGRYSSDYMPTALIYWLIPAVLLYRTLTTLIAPVWLARSGRPADRKRSFAFTLGAAVAVQAVLNVLVMAIQQGQLGIPVSYVYFMIADQLTMAAGIGLVLALSLPMPVTRPAESAVTA
jgi:hypothetical protein